MFKKIALGFGFIGCFSYAMKQPANIAKLPAPATLDISPQQFGLHVKCKAYIEALRDFAQVLLMQHRCFEASVRCHCHSRKN